MAAVAAQRNVVEVTDQTFGELVLAESQRRPVVVDFWAAWCQPCRLIGPVLERLAGEYDGQFLLAKVDVDANPQISQSFAIQSIPAVKAFRNGRLANEFIGAIPEQSIRQFLRSVVPSEADLLVFQGEQAEQQGRTEEAAERYHKALELEPMHTFAQLGVGRLAATAGDLEEARRILRFSGLGASNDVEKLLNSAIANAEQNPGVIAENLVVARGWVDQGPTLKRYRPRAYGRATRVRKRTAHVTLVVETIGDES